MSCKPVRPCGAGESGLGLVPPPPGLAYLRRRVGDFWSFLADVEATTERQHQGDGLPLGTSWDVEGDPRADLLARLWSYVAEVVAAYTELTASEAYLGTATDWSDLRRIAHLVGFRPRPGIAAQGWVEVDIDKGADPVMPARTRVQAPAAPPARPKAQSYEVAEDTPLRAEWAGLTATAVPQPAVPAGRDLRFLVDPGFRAGDRVLFLLEQSPPLLTGSDWFGVWLWILLLITGIPSPTATPLAVAKVVGRRAELGTTVVTFDRDLASLLPGADQPYVAYRVMATTGSARRLTKVLTVPPATVNLSYSQSAIDSRRVVLDAALDDVSAEQSVAVVDWKLGSCDVRRVERHVPVDWEVTPGTPTRASELHFAEEIGTLGTGGPVTVYVLDRRVVARHYDLQPLTAPQLRLYPAPEQAPTRLALRTVHDGILGWEVVACRVAANQEDDSPAGGPPAPKGLVVDLVDGPPVGTLVDRGLSAPASANLVRVRHGISVQSVLGSGEAAVASQAFAVPDAPVAHDLDAAGTPMSTLVVRVDGVAWDEVPSLFGQPPSPVFSTVLAFDGGETVRFGDGRRGGRLPTGRNNVTAAHRVGGGLVGEVPSGAITSLVGSVRGVKKVAGAGPTSGGADQDDERRLRALAPGRARAFGRIVSEEDLVDLAVAYPGVTHSAAWHGAGPPGCACDSIGLHVAFLRAGSAATPGGPPVPRAPLGPEVNALSAYLDGRRDTFVPLCVCAGVPSMLALDAVLATDPRREAGAVVAAAANALVDAAGPLAPLARSLGQSLDQSDIVAVLHGVSGVVGVSALSLTGGVVPAGAAEAALGRQPAARYELLSVTLSPTITAVSA